jgi:phosphatidate phosphatase APP1
VRRHRHSSQTPSTCYAPKDSQREQAKHDTMSQHGSSWGGSQPNASASSFAGGLANRFGNALYGEDRQQGTTRAKLRGYLSGIKESYQQNYAGTFRGIEDFDGGLGEAYPDANITRSRSGDEEMILFPSYSRMHIKERNNSDKREDPNDSENLDSNNNGQDGQAIHQHWDRYTEKDPIVDVDIRGWIYTPHKGPMSRKQRLALGIARQLAGLQNLQGSPSSSSPQNSRSTSPHPIRQKLEEHNARTEQRLVDMETENMLSKAQDEADKADRGEYSERYGRSDMEMPRRVEDLRRIGSTGSDESLTMAQKRASWSVPSEMSPEEATLAQTNLMNRLRPFYANPLANVAVSAFFYNEKESRQRTIYTSPYGQFNLRASLDFIPTHVRILASENLSATQEIKISQKGGISVISDIDDTIKHTAMLSGAREAFRNAFLRNLDDLVIDGVQDWYSQLAKLGVEFHYVSNSPWQLFPALSRFFAIVGLPRGSIHLKQYSGYFQGIFEPVAERKKSTLDRIARDFPERYFILVGDSGEADLEVYMDFIRENPGRVLGVFIRDVTTPIKQNYFDSNLGAQHSESSSRATSPRPGNSDHRDPELKAAIEASLKEFEAEEKRRGNLSPNSTTSKRQPVARFDTEDLISFSDSDTESKPVTKPNKPPKPPPPPPKKPDMLRGSSINSQPSSYSSTPQEQQQQYPPPPRLPPRQGSAASAPGIPTSNDSGFNNSAPPLPPRRAATASLSNAKADQSQQQQSQKPSFQSQPVAALTNYSAAAAQYASSRVGSTISSYYGNSNNNNSNSSNAQAPQTSQTYPSASTSATTPPATNSGLTRAQTNRIDLWKKRWATVADALRREGVVLRSWRVGTDVLDESVRLVEKARKLEQKKREGEKLIDI